MGKINNLTTLIRKVSFENSIIPLITPRIIFLMILAATLLSELHRIPKEGAIASCILYNKGAITPCVYLFLNPRILG